MPNTRHLSIVVIATESEVPMANKISDKVKEALEKLEKGIDEVCNSEKYLNYLKFLSKFHRYSYNNCIMIFLQFPDATLVAGYNAWKKMGRTVKRGEKGIQILAPVPYKVKVEDEDDKPLAEGEIEELSSTDNGQTVIRTFFKPVYVFDVSQTEGKEIETPASELKGDVKDFDTIFECIKSLATVPVEFEDIPGTTKGYYSRTKQKIAIKNGMSQEQTLKTLVHELTHSRLHCDDKPEDNPDSNRRQIEEVEAESVAYVVCSYLGIDTGDYSFAYVDGWSSRDRRELKGSLSLISRTADQIIKEYEDAYSRIQKGA